MEKEGFDQNFLSELSVRAQNVCLSNDLYNRIALIEYVRAGFDLRSLRNCGAGTVEELQRFIPPLATHQAYSALFGHRF